MTEEITAEHPEAAEAAPAQRSRWEVLRSPRRWAGWVVLGLFCARLLTPAIGGIITNDAVGYLARSGHPFDYGFVVQGYRQAGYPVWLHIVGWLEWPLHTDTIFLTSLVQRLMLLVGVLLAWAALRWWTIPLLVVVTSATFVMHTDYLLIEGFLTPVSLIIGALCASVVTGAGWAARHPRAAVVIVTVLSVAMGAMKLQYAVTLLLAAAIAWLAFRDGAMTLRFGLVTLVLGGLFMTGLTVGQTIENHRELGTWEPVGERARAEWYGAWVAVFTLHPENRSKPELEEFYDGGSLYPFLHGIEAEEPDYVTRQAAIRQRVADMFAAAGVSRRDEQLAALLGGIKGGRSDEIAATMDEIRDGGDRSFQVRIDRLSKRGGAGKVLDQATNGHDTQVLSVAGLTGGLQARLEDYRPWRPFLGIAALLVALLGCVVRGRHRVVIAATTLSVVSVCTVLATAYIDNARYLVGPMTLSLLAATLGARALVLAYLGDRTSGDD